MNVRRIPGMKPRSTLRNLLVGAIYTTIAIVTLIIFPILVALSPFILGLSVWKNWFGLASRFQRLPGISEKGGLKSGILVYLYLSFGAIFVVSGFDSTIGNLDDGSSSEVEAGGGTTPESDFDAAGQSSPDSEQEDSPAEEEPTIPAYSPAKAEDISYPGQDRVEVSVKLVESRPELTEEEALLIGKDVVESRKSADVVYVQIYQPEGEIGAGACASIKWTKDSGYEVTITRISCTDPEW